MPVQHAHTVRAGTTSKLVLVYIADGVDCTSGKPGLAHDTPGASAAYIREGQAEAREVPLIPGRVGEWAPGGFVEVDARLLPGVYQFAVPDEMLTERSPRVILLLRFPGASVKPVEIDLVAYDPQDAERVGLWSLSPGKRHEFLRQALPRFTEMELALGQQAEGELRAKLAPGGGE
jgi:hypothetical protein